MLVERDERPEAVERQIGLRSRVDGESLDDFVMFHSDAQLQHGLQRLHRPVLIKAAEGEEESEPRKFVGPILLLRGRRHPPCQERCDALPDIVWQSRASIIDAVKYVPQRSATRSSGRDG